MSKNTPEQLLQQQAVSARNNRLQALQEQQETESMRSQFTAQLLSYDAEMGAYLCQLTDGTRLHARSITPSGSRGIGGQVSLTKVSQGIAIIRHI